MGRWGWRLDVDCCATCCCGLKGREWTCAGSVGRVRLAEVGVAAPWIAADCGRCFQGNLIEDDSGEALVEDSMVIF